MPIGTAAQLPDNHSDYMKTGRSQRPGPVTGTIECLNLSFGFLGSGPSSHERAMTHIPGRYTILAVTWYSRALTGTPNFRVSANLSATPYVAGISIKDSIDMAAIPSGIDRSSVLAVTDVDGDTNPMLNISLNMSSASLTDFSATVWYFREGHVNPDAVDD